MPLGRKEIMPLIGIQLLRELVSEEREGGEKGEGVKLTTGF